MKAWQWFLAHGDKLLVGVAAVLLTCEQVGWIPHSTYVNVSAVLSAITGLVHTIAAPEPTPPPILPPPVKP